MYIIMIYHLDTKHQRVKIPYDCRLVQQSYMKCNLFHITMVSLVIAAVNSGCFFVRSVVLHSGKSSALYIAD